LTYAVLIARQRTGTSALGSLLEQALEITPQGEALDPLNRSPAVDPAGGVVTFRLLDAYLGRLAADRNLHLVDIKVNSLWSVGKTFHSPSLPPPLIGLLARDRAKVIRLHRHPVDQWISGLVADALGVWHTSTPLSQPIPKVRVDPTQLSHFLDSCRAEDELLARWLDGLQVLNLTYDQVFGPEGYPLTVTRVADFLGAAKRPNWQTAQPRHRKIARRNSADNVGNLAEIRHLMPIPPDPPPDVAWPAPGDLPKAYQARVAARQKDLALFGRLGLLDPSMLAGRRVLDWECGDGAFAVALGLAGAQTVICSDSWLHLAGVPAAVRDHPRLHFRHAAIGAFADQIAGTVDLVFANTVTEHMPNLVADFAALYKALKSGGHILLNHDNYYQPVGSHDHGFLNHGTGRVERQGPSCWDDPRKCAASDDHRADVARRLPWTWDQRNDQSRDPANCEACHYYRRSQPWAHLIYQDDFATLYPQSGFTTGQARSSLNKVTTFQLRQFLVEAGFRIVKDDRARVQNQPPPTLTGAPGYFDRRELQTTMYRVLACKP
jgi:SAM-dependent methyltransferase